MIEPIKFEANAMHYGTPVMVLGGHGNCMWVRDADDTLVYEVRATNLKPLPRESTRYLVAIQSQGGGWFTNSYDSEERARNRVAQARTRRQALYVGPITIDLNDFDKGGEHETC